ncbi:MAG: imidazole glycerol phosphate synthase subunit HisH [Nanoarchaeota archaeon]|nr:imidazole glycerol phosphate synthase subunit HisH [Nanoarchaeota archaeon]
MIGIIDYGAGNLKSVQNALDYLGVGCGIVSTPEEIALCDRLILPGDGSFGFMMENLEKKRMVEPLKKYISSGKPFLGICLGMQGLFESSEESPGIRGLGIFKGDVVRLRTGKIPQIGWNTIAPEKKNDTLFKEGAMYFVNSYVVVPMDASIIAARTDYFGPFVSAVRFNNVTAVQFHPEKSGAAGLALLKRWLSC